MSADQKRVVVTDVLNQTVTVNRRARDGMVWLHAPQGVALDRDEAWRVAQAMIADDDGNIAVSDPDPTTGGSR